MTTLEKHRTGLKSKSGDSWASQGIAKRTNGHSVKHLNGNVRNDNCVVPSTRNKGNMSMQLQRWSHKVVPQMSKKIHIAFLSLVSHYKSMETVETSRLGIEAKLLYDFADGLSVSPKEVCNYLQIMPVVAETAYEEQGKLGRQDSDTLLRALSVYRQAVEVFDSEHAAATWFLSSVDALDGETPASLLDTDSGVRMVRDILSRLEYGMVG